MVKRSAKWMLGVGALLAVLAVNAAPADDYRDGGKGVAMEFGRVQEAEPKSKMEEPRFGYEGHLGCFVATKSPGAEALIVVHQFPDTSKTALGRTKLTYEGNKRLGNVDGYVFKTEWDGKIYPSKIFLSSEKAYFGGGVSAYIAADFRADTGWVWKLHPLRRLEVVNGSGGE